MYIINSLQSIGHDLSIYICALGPPYDTIIDGITIQIYLLALVVLSSTRLLSRNKNKPLSALKRLSRVLHIVLYIYTLETIAGRGLFCYIILLGPLSWKTISGTFSSSRASCVCARIYMRDAPVAVYYKSGPVSLYIHSCAGAWKGADVPLSLISSRGLNGNTRHRARSLRRLI